jgi:diguanylate cyclase
MLVLFFYRDCPGLAELSPNRSNYCRLLTATWVPMTTFASHEILIVDDDRASADALAARLTLRRFRVDVADDGERAIERIEARKPDLLLLDAVMPGMDGRQVLAHIRTRFGPSELPVIMLTALDDRGSQRKAFDAGANDFVIKPADHEVLIARILAQIAQRNSFSQMQREQARLQRRLKAREQLGSGSLEHPFGGGDLLGALRADLAADKFTLAYQPKYDLRSGKITGLEALLRWANPYFSAVTPEQFVAAAEEGGAIASLTHWTIRRALQDHAVLRGAGYHLPIAINISPSLICDRDAADALLDHIRGREKDLVFELTESAILHDPQEALRSLHACAQAGVRLSIDDYGTGWSSLIYLQRLPIHELKIDRAFITRLACSHRDPLIVRSTIELAHAMDLEVIAEGVEDAQTLAFLRAMHCDIAQGYHIARPMPFADLIAVLTDERRIAALAEAPSPMDLFAAALRN